MKLILHKHKGVPIQSMEIKKIYMNLLKGISQKDIQIQIGYIHKERFFQLSGFLCKDMKWLDHLEITHGDYPMEDDVQLACLYKETKERQMTYGLMTYSSIQCEPSNNPYKIWTDNEGTYTKEMHWSNTINSFYNAQKNQTTLSKKRDKEIKKSVEKEIENE